MQLKIFAFTSVISIFAFIFTSCGPTILGSGKIETQNRTVSEFDEIDISGGHFNVFLRQGSEEDLKIEADDNLLEVIESDVIGNTLTISNNQRMISKKGISPYITIRELSRLEISGASTIKTKSPFNNIRFFF